MLFHPKTLLRDFLKADHSLEEVIACAQLLQSCPTLWDISVHGDSPGKNTRVSCHALNQGILLTQRPNISLLHLPHCRRSLYPLSWKPRKIYSVQFSCSVVSDSLWPHGLQHGRLPCPSPSPEVCSNSCPLSRWWHATSHPLSSPSPPAFNLSQHEGRFQWVSSSHHVAKVLELQLSISPSNEYSGLISFRIDWLDILSVQQTSKSLLQHHSSKASVLPCSAFFIVQISYP